jgi:retron-type reverse transcriptase
VAKGAAAAGRRIGHRSGSGQPQGASISPLLANLFMHYAFDTWMAREFPDVPFERFVDDVIVHCVSEQQARGVKDAIASRLAECGGLRLHPDKTCIVYCKDSNRHGRHWQVSFDFLRLSSPRCPVSGDL